MEEIQEKSAAAANHVANVLLHEGAEYDRPHAFLGADQIDLTYRFNRRVNGGDKWHSHLTKFDAVELRHEAVTHCFCSNTRLIGNKKHGSFDHGSLRCWRVIAGKVFHLTHRPTSSAL